MGVMNKELVPLTDGLAFLGVLGQCVVKATDSWMSEGVASIFTGCSYRVLFEFPNGYGASVIQSEFSYGGQRGLWEVGTLLVSEGCLVGEGALKWSQVVGFLTTEGVTELLNMIMALPPAKEIEDETSEPSGLPAERDGH
jgi:hypothetical protein